MNAEQFAYWVQGALELGGVKSFDEQQTLIIQDHLNLVFNKVTPNRGLGRQVTTAPIFTMPTLGPNTTFLDQAKERFKDANQLPFAGFPDASKLVATC